MKQEFILSNKYHAGDERDIVVHKPFESSIKELPLEDTEVTMKRESFIKPLQVSTSIQQKSKSDVSKSQILVLDGVRAIACLAVITWHLNQVTPALHGINNYVASLVYFGDSGVILFFLLSGFLLFMPYAKALLFDNPWPSTYRFYVRRIFRILPGYFVTVFLLALLLHSEYFHRQFFLQILNFRITKVIDGTFWTLAVEMLYYLCLPLIAWLFRPIVCRGPVLWRLFKLTCCLFGMVIWGMLSKYWGLYIAPTTQFDFLIPRQVTLQLLPIIQGDVGNFAEVFAIGMFLCVIYTLTHNNPHEDHWRLKLARLTPLMWIVGLGILGVISLCHLYQVGAFVRIDDPKHIFPFLDPYATNLVYYWQFYQSLVYAIGYGLCMTAILYGSGFIKRFFEWDVMRNIGSISFSLYLWHLPLLYLFADKIAPDLVQNGFHHSLLYLALWCWAGITILPISLFLYRYVEKPGIQLGRQFEQISTTFAKKLLPKH